MRFAAHILSLALLLQGGLQSAYAQTQNQKPPNISVADYSDLTLPALTPPARLQKGQRVNKLKTLEGFEIKRFARRLGEISAIARGAEGQLYIADSQSGRVFIIPDSNQDGRAEQIRPLPYRFNAPSAVLSLDAQVYIADQDGIWQLPQTRFSNQAPIRLANLENTNSTGRYFLAAHQTAQQANPESLMLGYSTQNGKARLISVDIKTGQAKLIDETDGELRQLVMSDNAKPWVAYRNQDGLHIGPSFENATSLGQTMTMNGMALPQKDLSLDTKAKNSPDSLPDNLSASLRDHIFISRNDPVDVIALPTSLGSVLPRGRTVFSGLQNGRTAWGSAGTLHMDGRGLFVSDPYNGDLWLIKSKPINAPKSNEKSNRVSRLNALREEQEKVLKRDPLDGIYDSLFPDSKDKKDDAKPSPASNFGLKDKDAKLPKPPKG